MTNKPHARPVTSYEDYKQRYPGPSRDEPIKGPEDDLAEAAERRGRRVLREAAAGMLGQTDARRTPPRTAKRRKD